MKKFSGIFSVMVTAYDETGAIDCDAMAEMTSYLIGSGVHGLTVLGSGGECPYINHDLQKVAIDVVMEKCGGAVPVIVGINERGTDAAIEMANYAKAAGADGLLVALPVFYPLSEDDVYRHYQIICERVDIPVLYYNFPTHTHLALTPQQIAKVAQIGNIVGAKETIFKSGEVKELVDATYPLFLRCGRQISPQFRTLAEFHSPPNDRRREFFDRVRKEGHVIFER